MGRLLAISLPFIAMWAAIAVIALEVSGNKAGLLVMAGCFVMWMSVNVFLAAITSIVAEKEMRYSMMEDNIKREDY